MRAWGVTGWSFRRTWLVASPRRLTAQSSTDSHGTSVGGVGRAARVIGFGWVGFGSGRVDSVRVGSCRYVQEFFDSVAQASLATLYGVYTGTALLFSAAMVNAAGYKYSLLFSLTMYVACMQLGPQHVCVCVCARARACVRVFEGGGSGLVCW